MTDQLLARIENLESREQIRELVMAYALGVVEGWGERIARMFTNDGIFEIKSSNLRISGMDALLSFYRGMAPGASYPLPHVGLIVIDGDTAEHLGSMDVPAHDLGRTGYMGIYKDKLRRENGRWLFTVREFEFRQGSRPV